ncbi:hypothetical protein CBS470a_007039 [Colletotrichum nupharicola]|nr:hypothetical protein CBS470a_007039 [Colletotrichum nupharicola]
MCIASSAEATPATTEAGPLPTTNLSYDNLKQCTIPSISDVPFDDDDLHDFIDPNTGQVDELNPGLWQTLSMDEWLSSLVKNCPALSMPDNYADPTKFELPVALGKVLIASSELVLCADLQDCTWSSYGDNFPGPDRPPSVPDHSDASITNMRKWYALKAMEQVHFYYAQMQDNFDQAKIWGQGVLGTLVNNLNPQAHTDDDNGVGGIELSVWLDIATAVLAFTPLSSIVSNFANSLKNDAQIAEQADNLMAGIKKWKPLTSENLKDAAEAGLTASEALRPDPAKPADQFSKYASFSADFATQMSHMSSNVAQIWQTSMYGNPTADGGYLDMVMGGAFSAQQTGTPKVSDDLRQQYQQYILEKAAMGIWKNMQIFIYTSDWDNQADCSNVAMASNNVPGQACYRNQGDDAAGWKFYAPFMPEFNLYMNTYETDENYEVNKWYHGFELSNLQTQQYNISWKDIYLGSAACFDANNQAWYDSQNGDTVGMSDAAQPVTYTPEMSSYSTDGSTSNSSDALCHWNIPVLNSNAMSAANGCQNFQERCWDGYLQDYPSIGDSAPRCIGINDAPYDGPDSHPYGHYQFLAYGSQLFAGTTPLQCNDPLTTSPYFIGRHLS